MKISAQELLIIAAIVCFFIIISKRNKAMEEKKAAARKKQRQLEKEEISHNPEKRIQDLAQMRENGVISDEEFHQLKERIINEKNKKPGIMDEAAKKRSDTIFYLGLGAALIIFCIFVFILKGNS